jgi:elongation factor G
VPILIEVAIEARIRADQKKLVTALQELAVREASLSVVTDSETGQTVRGVETESQLELVIERLRREFGIEINVGRPQVSYRETPSRRSEADYTHKKQTGSGRFARGKILFEPGAPGSGYQFESKVVGGSIPEEFIPGVEKGLAASREFGVLAGFPVIDFKATLVDGAYHDWDSSVFAFEIAARAAFRDGLAKAQCKLLEPIMKIEVVTPESYGRECIDDMSSRRAQIQGTAAHGSTLAISAFAPLANMFGYVNTLRAMTQGQGTFSMAFSHYAPVPLDDPPPAAAMAIRA